MANTTTLTISSNNNGTQESTPLLSFALDISSTSASIYRCVEPKNTEQGALCLTPEATDREFAKHDSVSTVEIIKQETGILLLSSIPASLACILQYTFSFVNMVSLGHLGANELAAAALSNMSVFIIINGPTLGLASALDTFCPAAFTGSRDRTLVGFHLQRGIISVTIHFILMLPVLLNIESILGFLHQDPKITRLCGQFTYAQLPGMLPWMYFECIQCFIQAQNYMKASTFILLAAFPFHIASTYLFVWSDSFGIGFLGAAVANVVTFWATLLGIVAYCRYTEIRAAWGGWTRSAFTTMLEYYRLAIPSLVMVCSSAMAWELMVIFASYLGTTTLAAQSIVINTCPLSYQWANGIRIAISNRTGSLLGQARARRAEISSSVGLSIGIAWGMVVCAGYIAVAGWWGHIYTEDSAVIATTAAIMPLCGIYQLIDFLYCVSNGVLRSIGRQNAGAWIAFPCYYIIGLPFGMYLTYGKPEVGVAGLWTGLCISILLTSIGQTIICLRADYKKEVEKCLACITKTQNALVSSITTTC